MDENKTTQTIQTQQPVTPPPSQIPQVNAAQAFTTNESEEQTMFGGNANINYDESPAFEPVEGKETTENYDFQDFSPFDVNDENAIDNALVEEENFDDTPSYQENNISDDIADTTDTIEETNDDSEIVDESGVAESLNEEYSSSNQNHEILERFMQVYGTTKKILDISEDQTSFAFSGGETVNSKIEYQVYLIEDEENHVDLFFKKLDTHNDTGDEEEHLIQWTYHKDEERLDIFVDEEILYQIGGGYSEEEKRENMIIEKLNKFQNFFEGYYDDLAREIQRKKEIEEKHQILHEIFKNF